MSKVHVLRASGDLDISRYEEFIALLSSAPDDARRIVVDLSEVAHMDSMSLGALILAKFRWDQEGRATATIVSNVGVRRVMSIGNVVRRLNVVDSLDEALIAVGETCTKES